MDDFERYDQVSLPDMLFALPLRAVKTPATGLTSFPIVAGQGDWSGKSALIDTPTTKCIGTSTE